MVSTQLSHQPGDTTQEGDSGTLGLLNDPWRLRPDFLPGTKGGEQDRSPGLRGMMLNRGQQLWAGVGGGVAGAVWEAGGPGMSRGEITAQ